MVKGISIKKDAGAVNYFTIHCNLQGIQVSTHGICI